MTDGDLALRLSPALLEEARHQAERQSMKLETFVTAALIEKLSALRTTDYFSERAARANVRQTMDMLARAGVGNPPDEGDDLPAD